MELAKLVAHPDNNRIYSQQDLGDLEMSLEAHGHPTLPLVKSSGNQEIVPDRPHLDTPAILVSLESDDLSYNKSFKIGEMQWH